MNDENLEPAHGRRGVTLPQPPPHQFATSPHLSIPDDAARSDGTPLPPGMTAQQPHALSRLAEAVWPPVPGLPSGELGRLGGYRILELLGEGGMGSVYVAEDEALRRLVAVKVMRAEIAGGPKAKAR